MENQNSNLGLNLPTSPPNGASPFNQFSPYLPPTKPTAVEEPGFLECCVAFLNSKKVTETAIWFVLLLLFVPSGMAVASWNAVPGDYTYSWKTGLEKGLLLVLRPSKTLQTSTQVALTQRRYAEAAKLLRGDQAQLGLKNLSEQVETTSDSIQSLSDGSSKTAFTMQYIEALTELNEKLEQEKKQHQGSSYQPSAPMARKPGAPQKTNPSNGTTVQGGTQATGGVIIQNTYVQNTIIQTVTAAPGAPVVSQPATRPFAPPTPPVDDVTTEIIQTQEQIQNTIAELQTHTTTQPAAQPTSAPAQDFTEAPAPKAAAPKAAEPSADNNTPASNEAPAPKAVESQSAAPKAEEPKEDSNKGSNDNSGSSNSGSGSGSGD